MDAKFAAGDVLLFGSERRGLPAEVLATIAPENVLSLPMLAGNRSLNLSNAAAIAVYEAWRQLEFAVRSNYARQLSQPERMRMGCYSTSGRIGRVMRSFTTSFAGSFS